MAAWRLASVLLVALTLLAAHVPEAVSQRPARPEPEELWRQFPLDSARSKQQTPAEARSAPVSPPTSGTTRDEGDRSLQTAEIAAVVLTLALVLILTTGMLTYALQGRFEPGIGDFRRGRIFRQRGDALREAAAGGLQYAARRWRRRVGGAAAARLRQVLTIRSNLRGRTVPADPETTGDELATLIETLDTYVSPRRNTMADRELERLKAKLDVHPASTASPRDDDLTVLKAKRRKPAARDVERPDEVETLKAKLTGSAGAETTTRDVVKAKRVDRGAPPKALRTEAARVASLKAKLDIPNAAADKQARLPVNVDGRDVTAGEPEERRAADASAHANAGRLDA